MNEQISSLWPTVLTADNNYNRKRYGKSSQVGLATEVKIAFGGMSSSSGAKMEVSAPLNPEFAEWLMGWPIGWTASAPLAMDKFQSWLPPHGISFNQTESDHQES
ncbi:MAG: hypothetical protein M1608_13450 [Candidatus Omnitrophica bacterium]|nr:hypothetical protein [Candidatus Omnitrophota bacterium]